MRTAGGWPARSSALGWMTALLIVVMALGVRLLNYDLLFVDEYLSMRNAGLMDGPLTYPGVIDRTIREDLGGMGVLYHITLKAWGDLTGATPYAVRAYSLLWGVMAVAWMYRLGADMAGRRVGLYAAALLGSSAFFIDYLHEARAYSQFVVLTIIVVWLYWRIQQQARPALGWYAAFALSIGWLVYTHYLALAMGAVLGLVHLINLERTRRWWQTLTAMALGGVLFVPWLGITIEVVRRGASEVTRHHHSMTAAEFLPSFFYAAASGNTVVLLLLGGLLLPAWRWQGWRRAVAAPAFLLLVWLALSLLLVVIVNARIPFMVHLRYLIFLLPALALLGAYAIAEAGRRGLPARLLLGAVVVVGAGQSFNPHFIGGLFGQIYRAPAAGMYRALDIVRERADATRDALIIHVAQPGQEPFQLFPNDYLFHELPVKRAEQFELMNLSLMADDNGYMRDALPVFDGIDAVWTAIIPEIPTTNRSGVVSYILDSQFASCGTLLRRDDIRLNLYMRPGEAVPVAQRERDGQRIAAYAPRLTPGESLHLAMLWALDGLPPGQFSTSIRLLDAAGNIIEARDFGLPDERPLACVTTDLPWGALPAGDYRVVAYVYNWQTLERFTDDPLLLAEIVR